MTDHWMVVTVPAAQFGDVLARVERWVMEGMLQVPGAIQSGARVAAAEAMAAGAAFATEGRTMIATDQGSVYFSPGFARHAAPLLRELGAVAGERPRRGDVALLSAGDGPAAWAMLD
ncbi:MAG: hypothetical protein F9K16_12600 [Thermoanaerobaculia bacterium]|nr:MAG: hypothetical protein F9K16_12600 [Thermoanaerobaculia bacterium]MBZ0102834.1 hypothetical protein [Thermoanaerobaculia bacterium]